MQPSRRPVGLKVANGEIMGGGTHEATISMEFWEHEHLNSWSWLREALYPESGVQITEYGMAPQVYARMIETLGANTPGTDVSASRDAPQLTQCRRHWHRGDSAWHRHWGPKE